MKGDREMTEVRGSTHLLARLFDGEPTDEQLGAALASARDEYRVLRWWKYGQPAVDAVRARLDVSALQLGGVLNDILKLHNELMQITVEVFPYGIPSLDGAQVNLLIERQIAR
jgi:hypothetical protein